MALLLFITLTVLVMNTLAIYQLTKPPKLGRPKKTNYRKLAKRFKKDFETLNEKQ